MRGEVGETGEELGGVRENSVGVDTVNTVADTLSANLWSCAVTISVLEADQTSSTQAGSITGFSFFTATLYFWLRA